MGNCQSSSSARRAAANDDDGVVVDDGGDREGRLLDSWRIHHNKGVVVNNSSNNNKYLHKRNLDLTEDDAASATEDRDTEAATLTPDSAAGTYNAAAAAAAATPSPLSSYGGGWGGTAVVPATPSAGGAGAVLVSPTSPQANRSASSSSSRRIGSSRRVPERSVASPITSPPSARRKQGRALQARLEKARSLQLALSHSSTPVDSQSPVVGGGRADFGGPRHQQTPMRGGDGDSGEYGRGDVRPRHDDKRNLGRAAPTSIAPTPSSLNAEFEATYNDGTIWVEADYGDKVSALALSRQQPVFHVGGGAGGGKERDDGRQDEATASGGSGGGDSSCSASGTSGTAGTATSSATTTRTLQSPRMPLWLAVGTDRGCVSISEVLDHSPSSPLSPSTTTLSSSASRLGRAVSHYADSRVRAVDFSPCGSFLAVGLDDCTCEVLRLVYDDERQLVALTVEEEIQRVDRVYCVQYSPNGRYLAVGGFDGTVAIYDRDRNHELLAEIIRDGLVFSLDWSFDGSYLAIGGSDKCCAIVDVRKSWNVCQELKRYGIVQCVKWYPTHNQYLAIGSSDVAIAECRQLSTSFSVKHEISCSNAPGEEKDHRLVSMSASSDRWGSATYKVDALCWSPNGTYLCFFGSDKKNVLLETKTYTPVHEIRRSDKINSAVWGQQSVLSGIPQRYLVLGGDDKKVAIFKAGLEFNSGPDSVAGDDLSSYSSSLSLSSSRLDWILKENVFRDMEDLADLSTSRVDVGASETVLALAFSRGSKSRPSTFLAYSLDDGRVIVRSTIEWKVVAELRFAKPINCIAFSNGSRFLALGSSDSRVHVTGKFTFPKLLALRGYLFIMTS